MRLTDVQLTIPSILMALLVNGIAKSIISQSMHSEMAIYVLIFAIGISEWPQFARVSKHRPWLRKIKNMSLNYRFIKYYHYVQTHLAKYTQTSVGHCHYRIGFCNLSFLGVGSLGTLIRFGNSFFIFRRMVDYVFPAIFLIILALSINLLGDWMIKSKIKNKMSLLQVTNLNISYPTRKETIVASKDVEFNLERGEILGIVGESGSGKSTIANAIINLIDPPGEITGGSIKIDDNELRSNEDVIQKIQGKENWLCVSRSSNIP